MAIGQVELNNAMTRIQDFTTQRTNEEQRSVVQMGQAQDKFNKELNQDMKSVIKNGQEEYQNKTQYQNKKFDAKEKGSNTYFSDGKKRKEKDKKSEGSVTKKQRSGFDIRI